MQKNLRYSLRKIHRAIKKPLQRTRLYLGHKLVNKPKEKRALPPLSDLRKILFMHHDGKIGDYIVASFIYRELKTYAPHIQIDIIAHSNITYLFDNNIHIDHVIIPKQRRFLAFAQLGWQLHKNKYDIVIDTTVRLRNRDVVLIRNINAAFNIGYNQPSLTLFNINIKKNQQHVADIYSSILTMLGISNFDQQYDLPCNTQREYLAKKFIDDNVLGDYIAVNCFGASSRRTFSRDNIYHLLTLLLKKNPTHSIVLLTYPAITPYLAKIIIETNSPRITLYQETETIFDSIAIIRHACGVISPDTAIVHIAAGLQKPLIAFYNNLASNDDFYKWHPNSKAPYRIIGYRDDINTLNITQSDLAITPSSITHIDHTN